MAEIGKKLSNLKLAAKPVPYKINWSVPEVAPEVQGIRQDGRRNKTV